MAKMCFCVTSVLVFLLLWSQQTIKRPYACLCTVCISWVVTLWSAGTLTACCCLQQQLQLFLCTDGLAPRNPGLCMLSSAWDVLNIFLWTHQFWQVTSTLIFASESTSHRFENLKNGKAMPAIHKMLAKLDVLAAGLSPRESQRVTSLSMNALDTVTLHVGSSYACRLWQKLPSLALP